MNIGLLTGGGDCPGLNAVIRAVVRKADKLGYQTFGIRNGWIGLLTDDVFELTRDHVSGIIYRGGTILGTSRTNPYKEPDGEKRILEVLKKHNIDVLIPIGGEDTLGVAAKLMKAGVNAIGIPKTIDNDLGGTDFTFGFDTAVNIAMEAIDRLHTTAESHKRVMVIEVMGRHAGWIALYAGVAGGADVILVPEQPFSVESVCDHIRARIDIGRTFSIIVVAEGAKMESQDGMDKDGSFILSSMKTDSFGHVRLGGIGAFLSDEIEKRLDVETRSITLGHIQRGGTPTAFDRMLGTRYGVHAVELAHQGKFGRMVALHGNKIVDVDIHEGVDSLKTLDPDLYKLAEVFFG
jgi:ATP-dependent phosphofructokinase / diphosphate-dependent phosphofructokinase